MKQVVTSGEIKEIEQYAINEIGIPSLVLMERAALSISGHIKRHFTKKDKGCVVCGSGNNGADGVAIARQLLEADFKVTIVILGKAEKFSEEMKTQLSVLKNLGVSYLDKIPENDFAYYVDAIFGVGLAREITDESILNAIDTINSSDAYIYSVDIPSGIHTDNGKLMGKAVKADETITFTCEKVGLCLKPGKEYAGKVSRKDIGILSSCIKNSRISHFAYEESDGAKLLIRDEDGNKGTFGKVAIIAGNEDISGACALCAKAVLKSGAGMIKVLSSEKTLDVIRKTLPEAMVQSLDNIEAMENNIQSVVSWADCVVIGPGIGTDENACLKMLYVLKDFPKEKSLVIDADGINILAKYEKLKELTYKVNKLVYTPHMLELSRLTGCKTDELKDDLDKVMKEVITGDKAVYVCKDSVTRVYKNDKPIFINGFGNSGMATAGSGDVLAGIIGAMVARAGMDLYEGVVLGVHLHSLAGDLAADDCGKNSLVASDIIEALPKILKKMEEFS